MNRILSLLIALVCFGLLSAFARTSANSPPEPRPMHRQSIGGDSIFYNQVVRLKNGSIIVGRVEYDEKSDQFTIKSKNGQIQTVLRRDVEVIEEYSRTYLPPEYRPFSTVYPCDIRQREKEWYFVEGRLWGMYAGKDESNPTIGLPSFTFGPELAAGFRLGPHWGVGLGASYFRARDISRIPFFLHGRYQFTPDCFSPFAYAQAGTVFDNKSGDHIALNKIFHPGPKIAGFGIGVDYAVSPRLDLSADIGYRYLQLPTKVPCDCSDVPPEQEVIYYNESHGILLRLGVTF